MGGKLFGLAMLYLVDYSVFGELLSGIQNYYVKGNDKYPSDMTEAYNILNHYIRDTKQRIASPNSFPPMKVHEVHV